MRTTTRWVALLATCSALALVALCAVPRPAHAADDESEESVEEASERFRRGVKLYKDADYVAALVEFKRAYELAPNYRVLYNLGQTSRELKDYASAIVAYQQYLDEGGDEIDAKRRKDVESTVDDLTDRVGKLTIATNVDGAEVQVDDEVVGVTPLEEPVVVNIGKRRISATLAGHAPARRIIEVAGRDELTVELELADLTRPGPSGPQPPTTPGTAADEGGHTPVAGIVTISIAGACGIVTGVLGGLALSAKSERDVALAAFPGNGQEIEDAQNKTDTFALATDVMIGVTSAAAITALVLFIVNPGSGSDDEQEEGADDVSLSVAPSVGGLWVTGSF